MPTVFAHAWRSWSSARAIALLATGAFAVGIGATTAIFTVVNGVILRPLPYSPAERFVALYGARITEPGQYSSSSAPDLIEYQRRVTSFEAFGWFRLLDFNLTSPGEPQYVRGVAITPSLAQNLGASPMIGRWFSGDTGAVISNALWKRLGANPAIVGSAMTLDNRALTIEGVMPPEFSLPVMGTVPARVQTDVWIYLDPSGRGQDEGAYYFSYARLKPGVSITQAQTEVTRVASGIAANAPASHPAYTARVVSLREDPLTNVHSTLLVLFGAAGLLLLISCANVATLLLARAVARARETAIRVALGASRRQLALRYFVEGSIVSLAGAVAGILLSVVIVRVIMAVGSAYIPRATEIGIDWKVVAFTFGVAFAASALASLAPLWQAIRTTPNAVLSDGVRASAGARSRVLSKALVVAEIALTFALLTVSAVLLTHLRSLGRVAPGFNTDDLLTFELTVPQPVLTSPARVDFQRRLVEALDRVASVSSAAFVNQLPLDGCCLGGTLYPDGQPPTRDVRRVSFMFASPDYFVTVGIPLRAGRYLTAADTNENALFALINETAAKRYWPDRNAVGVLGRLNRPDGTRIQVVGVVGDVRNNGLNKAPEAEVYLLGTLIPVNPMQLVVRSPLPAGRLLPEIRRAIRIVDPTLAIHDARTMAAIVYDSLQFERVSSVTMTSFAIAAVFMAALGIYGVVSYSVRQRTVEVGTRMALGATRRDLLGLVVGGGLRMAAAGLVCGAVAVVGGLWLLVRFLEVRDIAWPPIVGAATAVVAIAAVASLFPAWRATLLPPMVAIRDEPGGAWRSTRLRIRRVMQDITRAASSESVATVPESALLTEFVSATRNAQSFRDALRMALSTLSDSLAAEFAVLMEHSPLGFHCSVSVGDAADRALSLPAGGFLLNRLKAYPHPQPFTSTDFESLARWAAGNRPDRLEEISRLAEARIRLAVPLRTNKEVLGVLLLGPPTGRHNYTAAQRRMLRTCGDHFALMIENARLTDRVVEQETARRDLALAAEVQKRLLPEHPPQAAVAELAALSLPARTIGGDYYDFIDVGDRRIAIALADVSGKGVAAALIMSVVQASLRIIASEGEVSLPRLAERLNRYLYKSTPSNKYATFFYAQVDETTQQLRYVNAGHNPPYLVRRRVTDTVAHDDAANEIQELAVGGAVVGLFPDMSYEEGSVDLRSGDVLVAFTDGVTEAQNPRDEEFGEERLKALLCQVAHLPAHDISAHISAELKAWINEAPQYDDLTYIVMKVN
jgi:predicted permease